MKAQCVPCWQSSSPNLSTTNITAPHDCRHPAEKGPAPMPNQKASCCSSCALVNKPVLSAAEFQDLPPSIQRKYFTTLERLQILHSSNAPDLCSQQQKTRLRPRTSGTTVIRPNTSTSLGSTIRRRKKRNSLTFGQLDPKVESTFFLALPDKIRRQQFSKEEQRRISSQLGPSTSLTSLPRSPQGFARPSTTSSAQLLRQESIRAPRKDSKIPSIEVPRPVTQPMNCFDGKPSRAPSKRLRKPSLPRDGSMHRPGSSVLSPKSQYSGPTLCSPTSPAFPSPHHHRQTSSRTVTMSFVRPSIDSTVSIDAAATYYQDPEARMKLRKYLASPQKFDEAVAFGFPSLPARTSAVEKDLLRTPHSTSGNDAQRFLREDTLQFVDRYSSDSSDDDTLSYNESPVTPADSEDAMPRSKPYGASIFAGLERTEMPSLKFQFEGLSEMEEEYQDPDPAIFDPLANREMTLRMTLTKPELRATEEALYGWRDDKDPLALEDLQLSDDMTGQNGAFAVKSQVNRPRKSGVFKKFLDRIKA